MKPPVEAPTSSARRPADGRSQRVERVRELDAAARDVRRRAVDLELDLRVDELARLLRAAPAGAEVHLARDDGRGRARARLEQPALRQQGVQAHAGHEETVPGARAQASQSRPMGP